jgi:hypothetical protein
MKDIEYLCESCLHFRAIRRDGDAPEYLPHDIRVCLDDKGYWVDPSRDAVRCRHWRKKRKHTGGN